MDTLGKLLAALLDNAIGDETFAAEIEALAADIRREFPPGSARLLADLATGSRNRAKATRSLAEDFRRLAQQATPAPEKLGGGRVN